MKETNSSICDIRKYCEMLTGIKVVLKFALILNNQPPDLKNSINSVWSKRNGASKFVVRPGCPRYVHL